MVKYDDSYLWDCSDELEWNASVYCGCCIRRKSCRKRKREDFDAMYGCKCREVETKNLPYVMGIREEGKEE